MGAESEFVQFVSRHESLKKLLQILCNLKIIHSAGAKHGKITYVNVTESDDEG